MFSLSALHEVLHLSYNPVLKNCHQIYIYLDVLLSLLQSKVSVSDLRIHSILPGKWYSYTFLLLLNNSVACAIVAASVISLHFHPDYHIRYLKQYRLRIIQLSAVHIPVSPGVRVVIHFGYLFRQS